MRTNSGAQFGDSVQATADGSAGRGFGAGGRRRGCASGPLFGAGQQRRSSAPGATGVPPDRYLPAPTRDQSHRAVAGHPSHASRATSVGGGNGRRKDRDDRLHRRQDRRADAGRVSGGQARTGGSDRSATRRAHAVWDSSAAHRAGDDRNPDLGTRSVHGEELQSRHPHSLRALRQAASRCLGHGRARYSLKAEAAIWWPESSPKRSPRRIRPPRQVVGRDAKVVAGLVRLLPFRAVYRFTRARR